MKKIYLVILFLIIQSFFLNKSLGEEDYGAIFKKYENAIKDISSYRIKSEVSYGANKVSVMVDFVKPGFVRQTVVSNAGKEVNLYAKNKHYILVPGTDKWSEQEWKGENEGIKDLGELDNILEMMKKQKPADIETKSIRDAKYIVLSYRDISDWGNIHYVFQNYNSSIYLYLDAKSYLLKLATVEMSGGGVETGERLKVRQTNKFNSYNEKIKVAPPQKDDIFTPLPVSIELPAEIFHGEMKRFENSKEGISLMYPESWYTKEHAGTGVYQLFISKEKVEKPGDIFLTGLSIIKIYDAKKRIGLESTDPAAIAEEYLKRYVEGIDTSKSVIIVFANTPINVGEEKGYKTELTFTDKYGRLLTNFLVIMYKDDVFVSIILESTQQDFAVYAKMFMNMLSDMSVF